MQVPVGECWAHEVQPGKRVALTLGFPSGDLETDTQCCWLVNGVDLYSRKASSGDRWGMIGSVRDR